MIFCPHGVRLTRSELNLVRQAAARNGVHINTIGTRDGLIQALLDGLPPHTQDGLLAFLTQPRFIDTTATTNG